MAVKMRIEKEKDLVCNTCGIKWENTPEMYTIGFKDEINGITRCVTLCKDCCDELFRKTLRASCGYNERVKTKEDLERIKRNNAWKNRFKENEEEYEWG